MSEVVKSGQLWVVFDSDKYLKIKRIDDNTVYYSVVGSYIENKKSYDDFVSYAINADDVIGDYVHKSSIHHRISVRYDNTNNFLSSSNHKDHKMDLGVLYEYYNKEK